MKGKHMICFRNDNYKGEITYNGERLFFESAGEQDAGRIAAMYADIAIHAGNYRRRLDPCAPDSFEKTGGMFVLHSKNSVLKELAGGSSFFAAIKDYGGKLIAILWVSSSDPSFEVFDPAFFPALPEARREITEALTEGKVLYPREIIVDPGYRCKGMADILCYTVFSAARASGYICSLGEVYKVCGCRIGSTVMEAGMLNKGGYQTILGMGGRFIGAFPRRVAQAGALAVTIEPQVFLLRYDQILPVLEQSVYDCGAGVFWKGQA